MKAAKIGFYGGDPEKVLKARVDFVIAALDYDNFLTDYDNTFQELNKPEK